MIVGILDVGGATPEGVGDLGNQRLQLLLNVQTLLKIIIIHALGIEGSARHAFCSL
jgi:hypothetical protein